MDLSRVPDGSDRSELFEWLHGQQPFRDGFVAGADLDRVFEGMNWVHIEGTHQFWGDSVEDLSRAIASFATGLAQLPASIAVMATVGPSGLELQVGTETTRGHALVPLLRAHIPGLTLKEFGHRQDVSLTKNEHMRQVSTLWAQSDADAALDAPAVLDRFTALHGVHARIEALLVPIAIPELTSRIVALDDLAQVIDSNRIRQVQVTPTTTTSREDPQLKAAAQLVEKERERVTTMLRLGSFGVVARIRAHAESDLAAAVGAVAGAAPSAGCSWRPVATTSGDHRLPVASLSASDLVDLLRLPSQDVYGLPSRQFVRLDEHPEPLNIPGPTIELGMTPRGVPLDLPVNALTSHLLVTGGSGSGKSSATASLLVEVARNDIPILVIEPIKDEWVSLDIDNLRRWAPGAVQPGCNWPLPLLEVPEGTTIVSHLQWLTGLFRSSLDLPDPLPAIIDTGLFRVFEAQGWDLIGDRHLSGKSITELEWPTVSELVATCHEVIDGERYDPEIRGNLHSALDVRIGAFTRGPLGRAFDTTARCPVDEIFSSHVVCNLDAIADPHIRSFIARLLLIRIVAHRKASPAQSLQHLTVLEEAHVLLGNPGQTNGRSTVDPVANVAEVFGDQLAEMRALGEGFVVINQSPSRLVRSAIVNTATKISLRATDQEDQHVIGSASNLNEDERTNLASLSTHEALVIWEGMDRPIHTQLNHRFLHQQIPQSGEPPVSGAPRLANPPKKMKTAIALLARVTEQYSSWCQANAYEQVVASIPSIDDSTVKQLIESELQREVQSMARTYGWDREQRERTLRAVIENCYGTDHPSSLVATSPQSYLAFAKVCSPQSYSLGGVTAIEAERLLAEGPASIRALVVSPEERRRRLRRRVLEIAGACAPSNLHVDLYTCLSVQVFDSWADPDTVSALIRADVADFEDSSKSDRSLRQGEESPHGN